MDGATQQYERETPESDDDVCSNCKHPRRVHEIIEAMGTDTEVCLVLNCKCEEFEE